MVNIVFLNLITAVGKKVPFKPCTNITRIFFNKKQIAYLFYQIKVKMLCYTQFFLYLQIKVTIRVDIYGCPINHSP